MRLKELKVIYSSAGEDLDLSLGSDLVSLNYYLISNSNFINILWFLIFFYFVFGPFGFYYFFIFGFVLESKIP